MNAKEAEIVLEIMMTADGGCPVCGRSLVNMFWGRFPAFEEVINRVWRRAHEEEDDWKGEF